MSPVHHQRERRSGYPTPVSSRPNRSTQLTSFRVISGPEPQEKLNYGTLYPRGSDLHRLMFQEANKSTDFLAPPGKQNDKRTTCKWQVKRRFHNCSWLSGKSGIRFRTGWKIQLCENVAGSGIVVYVFIAANAENSLCVRVCMQCCCCCHVCHMAHDFEIPYKKKKKERKNIFNLNK